VMLEANFSSPPPSCSVGTTRVFPDGSKDTSAFVVPTGKVLILTDIDGTIKEDIPWAVGDAVHLTALVKGPSNQEAVAFTASLVLSSESANSGITVVSSHSQSGGLVGAGTTLCLTASWARPTSGGAANVGMAHLHGYLINE
jgi:hypothetical protein